MLQLSVVLVLKQSELDCHTKLEQSSKYLPSFEEVASDQTNCKNLLIIQPRKTFDFGFAKPRRNRETRPRSLVPRERRTNPLERMTMTTSVISERFSFLSTNDRPLGENEKRQDPRSDPGGPDYYGRRVLEQKPAPGSPSGR